MRGCTRRNRRAISALGAQALTDNDGTPSAKGVGAPSGEVHEVVLANGHKKRISIVFASELVFRIPGVATWGAITRAGQTPNQGV